MDARWAVPLIVIAVVAVSGCPADPSFYIKDAPPIRQFLAEHPNATVMITHYTEEESVAVSSKVNTDCGKYNMTPDEAEFYRKEPAEFYFVNVTDSRSGLSLAAWYEWKSQSVRCAIKRSASGAVVSVDA